MSLKLLDYDVLEKIGGSVSHGYCYKVKHKITQKLYASKVLRCMSEGKLKFISTKLATIKQLKHPNVVQQYEAIFNTDGSALYVIMEYCEGGDLQTLIGRCRDENCHFEEEFIWRCLNQLYQGMTAVRAFHKCPNIAYQDINASNVYLDGEGNVKFGIIGLARQNAIRQSVSSVTRLTHDIKENNSKSSLIRSIGCLLFELCALRPSRNTKDNGSFNYIPSIYSRDLRTIISFMLTVDHDYQSTVDMVMQHPTVLCNSVNGRNCFPQLVANEICPVKSSKSQVNDIFEYDTTYELRKDLFYNSPKILPSPQPILRKASSESGIRTNATSLCDDPNEATQEIFNQALRQRLIAIRDRESALQKQESELRQRELAIEKAEKKRGSHASTLSRLRRSSSSLDISTVTVEPNDTIIMPTIAKIDASTMPRPNGFRCKVSFTSSRNHLPLVKSENRLPAMISERNASANNFAAVQDDVRKSANANAPATKRKSIFGIFNFNSKNTAPTLDTGDTANSELPSDVVVGAKWTAETKRTAFEMLAIMNAKKLSKSSDNLVNANGSDCVIDDIVCMNGDRILRHDRKRQSMMMLRRNQRNILL